MARTHDRSGGTGSRIPQVPALTRRAALGLPLVAAAGCTPADTPTAPTPSSQPTPTWPATSRSPRSTSPSPTAASPSPTRTSASPSPTPAIPARPSRDELVERYRGVAPRQWGLEVDGVLLRTEAPQVALTFDACGGPRGSGYDAALIDLLTAQEVPATLFLNARWIRANPALTRDLIANPLFSIGNHGTRHVPLSVTGRAAYGIRGTASVAEVYDEVMGNQATLADLMGHEPRFFRPGTAFYDDVAARIVRDLGLIGVNFDVNADAGATYSRAQVARETARARAGSICLGHFNRPDGFTAEGLADALPRLRDKSLSFARLDQIVT